MPALRIFGKPTFLGGDDLRMFTICAVILRLLQLAVLIAFTALLAGHFRITPPEGCEDDLLLQHSEAYFIPYVVLTFVSVLVGLAVELGVWQTTGKGAPTEPERRWMLRPLCFIKMIPMSVIRFFSLVLAILSLLAVKDLCDCGRCVSDNHHELYVVWAVLVVTQFVEFAVVLIYAIYFGCKATPRIPIGGVSAETKWNVCCRCCCTFTSLLTCCLAGGRESQMSGDFAELGMLLAYFFSGGGIINVVLSDIIVGFRMLAKEQKQRLLLSRDEVIKRSSMIVSRRKLLGPPMNLETDDIEAPPTPVSGEGRLLSRKDASDKYVIAEGARFMRYADGVYFFERHGYRGERFVHACRYACRYALVEKDTVGPVTEHRLLAACGLLDGSSELVYAQFDEGLAATPYGIFLDHAWKSVIVTIRGTVSLDDVVADLILVPSPLDELGAQCGFDGTDGHAHTGILKCAEWVYRDLERHGWLEKLLSGESSRAAGYQLVITGHSLGGGISAILSYMLRAKFPDLKCRPFSPPGCTLSLNMAQQCEDFVTSYVLDTDIVPRLSLASMEGLRDGVLEMIARIKVPKYQAMHAKNEVKVGNLIHPKRETPDTDFEKDLIKFRAFLDEQKAKRKELSIPLYPPGKIVHLVKTKGDESQPSGGCCSCFQHKVDAILNEDHISYAAQWAKREDLAEVFISNTFLDDHKTINVLAELEKLAELFGLSSPYAIEEGEQVASIPEENAGLKPVEEEEEEKEEADEEKEDADAEEGQD